MINRYESCPKFTFDVVYRLPSILPFNSLTSVDGGGIPQRVKLFNTFDPQNTTYQAVKFTGYRRASLIECYHLLDYLRCEDLQKITCTRKYDPTVNAIVSLVLGWSREDRESFAKREPKYQTFMSAVSDFVDYEDGAYVYGIEFEDRTIPYCKCAFKLIKSVVTELSLKPDDDFDNEPFQIMRYVRPDFVNHLHDLYKKLMDETLSPSEIAELERPIDPPHNLEPRIGSYAHLKRTAQVKFITGQACAGKTTLLTYLNRVGGWQIMSRGKIGGFSGKADNPVAVAKLHAAVNFTLRHSNVLGVSIDDDDNDDDDNNDH